MRQQGFTFIEVLVGIAITGLLAVGTGVMVYSFSHLWLSLGNNPLERHHEDGVAMFIQYCADRSVDLAPSDIRRNFGWAKPPEREKATLQFKLEEETPFFVTDIKPFPSVTAYLDFTEDHGLCMLWHVDPKKNQNKTEMRRSLISDRVTDIQYGYWNSELKEWEYFSVLADNNEKADVPPSRLHIHFGRNEGSTIERLRFFLPHQNVFIY